MATFVQICVADILVNGMVTLAVGLVVYLLWLKFHEKPRERQDRQKRERYRRSHWGYE